MRDDSISRQAAIDLAREIRIPTKDGSIYRHRCVDPDAIRELSPAQPEVVRCKDCIHRPIINGPRSIGGFGLRFPDFKCPCRCDDPYYSWMPNDNWFCGNGEKEEKTNERKSRETGSGEVE